MMATIVISVIPLAFKETNIVFQWIDYVTVGFFILDYFLRIITADYKLEKSVYWATVSLTTVGYGDIYPVTTIGRIVTMISSALGIAIIALPSGVITAGYLAEIGKED